jgi:hypothetical protein
VGELPPLTHQTVPFRLPRRVLRPQEATHRGCRPQPLPPTRRLVGRALAESEGRALAASGGGPHAISKGQAARSGVASTRLRVPDARSARATAWWICVGAKRRWRPCAGCLGSVLPPTRLIGSPLPPARSEKSTSCRKFYVPTQAPVTTYCTGGRGSHLRGCPSCSLPHRFEIWMAI